MATVREAVDRLTIEYRTVGAEQANEKARQLGRAKQDLIAVSDREEKVVSLVERRLEMLSRRYDQEYRQQKQIEAATRDLTAARQAGLISLDRQNELLALAAQRHMQMGRAANDNAKQVHTSFVEMGSDVVTLAGHLKFLAVAAYAMSPAFRAMVNPAVTSALVAMGPAAVSAGGAILSAMGPAFALLSKIAVPVLAIAAAWQVLSQTIDTGAALLEKYGNAQRNLIAGVDDNLKTLTRFQDNGLSADQVQRATELGARLNEAKRTIEEFAKVQFDLTGPALALQAVWVGIVEAIAKAVEWANKLPNGGWIQDAARRFNNRNGLPDVTDDPRFLGPETSDKAVSQAAALTAAYERLRAGMGSTSNFAVRFGQAINDLQNPVKETTKQTKELAETVQRFNQYDNAVQRVRDQIEVLELQAQSFGKNTAEVVKLRTELDLKRAAQRAGIELSADEIAANETLAKKLGELTARLKEMNEARQIVEQFGSALVDALTSGAKAGERLVGALGGIGKNLATQSMNRLLTTGNVFGNQPLNSVQGAAGMLGAGALGYQAGVASGSRLTGALMGAAGGAMAGAAFGPWGAVAGGVIGGAAGLIGGGQGAEAAKQQGYQDNINTVHAINRRIAAAQHDTGDRIGQMAAMESRFQQERAEIAMKGAAWVTLIEKAQAAERAAIARQYAEQDLARQKQYQDRLLLAVTNAETLEGALTIFDRAALRQIEEEKKLGNAALVDLEAALAAERLNVIKEFNDRAIEEQRQAQEAILNIGRGVNEFLLGMMTGPNSALSPAARLDVARQAYEANNLLAQGGNIDAQSQWVQLAGQYEQAGRAYYGSSSGYQSIRQQIMSQGQSLPAVAATTDPVLTALNNVVAAVNATTGAVNTVNSTTAGVTGAVNTNNALVQTGNTLQDTNNALTTSSNSILAELRSLNSTLTQQFAGQSVTIGSTSGFATVVDYNPHAPVGQQFTTRQVQTGTGVTNYASQFTNGVAPTDFNANTLASRQTGLRVPSPVENSMLSALNKIVFNTYAIAHNTGAWNYRQSVTHLFGAYAEGGVIPAFGLGLVSEHSPGGGRFIRAGAEPITVSPHAPMAMNDNRDVVAAINRLHDRMARMEQRLADVGIAGAEHVGMKVDQQTAVSAEVAKRLRRDAA